MLILPTPDLLHTSKPARAIELQLRPKATATINEAAKPHREDEQEDGRGLL
jgi:hypothetical protein